MMISDVFRFLARPEMTTSRKQSRLETGKSIHTSDHQLSSGGASSRTRQTNSNQQQVKFYFSVKLIQSLNSCFP